MNAFIEPAYSSFLYRLFHLLIKTNLIWPAIHSFFPLHWYSHFAAWFSKAQQEVQINGKHFTVVSKVQLGSNTEYLTVKEKSAAQADNQAYVKKERLFQIRLLRKGMEIFFTKRHLSSLGELSSLQATKKEKITCIKKSGVQVLLAISNGEMIIIEYPGDPCCRFQQRQRSRWRQPAAEIKRLPAYAGMISDDCDSIIVDNPAPMIPAFFRIFLFVKLK